MADNRPVRLSIFCATYNQAKFIRQTLDGFVSQKTNFRYEILVHDDASTDGTTEIVRDYAARYPDLFVTFYETENQFHKDESYFAKYFNPNARGEYVAICEGDDYWTDPQKLQLQVDWLDAHPKCNVCFHPVRVHYEENDEPDGIFPPREHKASEFTFARLLDWNFIQTNSVVYRWQLKNRMDEFPRGILPGDWFMHLLNASNGGEIGFIPRTMAVYRRHKGGIWWKKGNQDAFYLRNGLAHLGFYKAVRERFGYENCAHVADMALHTLCAALRATDDSKVKELMMRFPRACGYAVDSMDALRSDNKKLRKRIRHLTAIMIAGVLTFSVLIVLLLI